MKAVFLASALLLSSLALTPASAAPAAPGLTSPAAPVILAQYPGHDRDRHRGKPMHPRYVPGHRYGAPPHGWHRYPRRPHDWHTRGCILVGPLWFCP